VNWNSSHIDICKSVIIMSKIFVKKHHNPIMKRVKKVELLSGKRKKQKRRP